MSEKLVGGVGRFLERRSSRRGLLGRAAVVGSAFAVAPVKFALYPDTAEARVRRPSNCGGRRCASDGFTEFCCSIGKKNGNECPPNSFVAGWWKCTRYRGGRLCDYKGHRYYVDCNRRPDKSCNCKCGRNRCGYRRQCCNVFRYGQCNTQIGGVTEVVCRMISCKAPWKVDEWRCNRTRATDNRTCSHEASCGCGDCARNRPRRERREAAPAWEFEPSR